MDIIYHWAPPCYAQAPFGLITSYLLSVFCSFYFPNYFFSIHFSARKQYYSVIYDRCR